MNSKIRAFVRVSRPEENLPLLLIPIIGWTVVSSQVKVSDYVSFLLLWSGIILVASQLNCLTDVEVDRLFKREFCDATIKLGRGLPTLIKIECGVIAGGVVIMIFFHYAAAVALLLSFALLTLYSYNFLARDVLNRVRLRWKTRPLVHIVAIAGGLYFLPMLGALSYGQHGLLPSHGLFAAAFALVSYSIFLMDCVADLPEDRISGIRTPADVLGARNGLKVLSVTLTLGTVLLLYGMIRIQGLDLFQGALGTLVMSMSIIPILRILWQAGKTSDIAAFMKNRLTEIDTLYSVYRIGILGAALLNIIR